MKKINLKKKKRINKTSKMWNAKIITAYPEMFPGVLAYSLIGKALKENIFTIETVNLHDFGIDNRKSIDDEPFGGGPGMVSSFACG